MEKVQDNEGITLVELLVVIVIISVLTAMALPSFVGQREKAKAAAIKASAKAVVPDVQRHLDNFISGSPFLSLSSEGEEICVQVVTSTADKTCQAVYNVSTSIATYSTVDDIIGYIIDYYIGTNKNSPFDVSRDLYTRNADTGTVVLTEGKLNSINIVGYASSLVQPVFSTTVSVK